MRAASTILCMVSLGIKELTFIINQLKSTKRYGLKDNVLVQPSVNLLPHAWTRRHKGLVLMALLFYETLHIALIIKRLKN